MHATMFEGIFPVSAAPFTDKGFVDYDSLKELVKFQIRAEAKGLVLFGFATEFYKLSYLEKLQMLKTVKEAVSDAIPIIASVTEQSTELAVWRAKEMQDNGADALMVLPPFLIRVGKKGFIDHIKAIAKAVQIPVIIQYSPEETGVIIEAKTLAELMASQDNLQYIKVECKPPGPMISELLSEAVSTFGVFVGYAGIQMMDALTRGAIGVMPGSSLTDIYCSIYKLYKSGKIDEANALHGKLVQFLNVIFQSIEMIIKWEKIILKHRGIIAFDYCRHPCYEPDAVAIRQFNEAYSKFAQDFVIQGSRY